MGDVSVKVEQDMSPAGLEAVRTKEEYIWFYQLGFLDAYKMCNDIKINGNNKKGESKETKLFQRISDKCKLHFEKRFFANLNKQIKKVKGA